MLIRLNALASSAAALLCGTASAQIDYVSQTRTADARATANNSGGSPVVDSSTASAPDFQVFDAVVDASVNEALGTGSATARHRSELLQDRIDLRLTPIASATAPDLTPNALGSGRAASEFEVAFDLQHPCRCELSGSMNYLGSTSSPSIWLRGPNGVSWYFDGGVQGTTPVFRSQCSRSVATRCTPWRSRRRNRT